MIEATELPPSLWAATAEPGGDYPPLSGREEADVAIVGGGFTGLSAALHLAEAGQTVRLLEAAEPGWGASGRNGGQVNPGWKILPDQIERRHGRNRGRRVVATASATCDLVFDLIKRHQIRCDAVRPGYVQGAFGARGQRFLQRWHQEWAARGVQVDLLSRSRLADLIGSDLYHSGLIDSRGGNLQPLSYARGLAAAAAKAGARLHGQSKVSGLARAGADWRLVAGQGELRARQVLLCTNGYTDSLWPGLRQSVVPVPSFIVATEPLSERDAAAILPRRHAVSETRHAMVYYRMDRNNRFVIGGRGNPFDVRTEGPVDHVKAAAVELYPVLATARWDYCWAGYVAMTPSHAPKLMRLDDGVFAGLGFNGRGIAMATMMGKQLSLATLGQDPDLPVTPLARIPLHGLRQIAISWKLLTGPWLDRLDHRRA